MARPEKDNGKPDPEPSHQSHPCPPAQVTPSTNSEEATRRIRWHHNITQNITQILLTTAGLGMGACAIALLIEEQRTPGTQLHESITAVVLLITWFAMQTTYIIIFCIRISTIPAFPTSPAALPPAAHYVLRTLTGVLVFIMLPITLAHLSRTGPVAEDFAVYLPFVMSLSAFINSLVGNPTQMLASYETRGRYGMTTARFPGYGSMGHGCCCVLHDGMQKHGYAGKMFDDCIEGAANGIAGSVV